MVDDKKYWLNEWGLRYWHHKDDDNIVLMRSYYWVDSIIGTKSGVVKGVLKFSEFDDTNWVEMDLKYFRRKKLDKLNENIQGNG